MSKTFKCPSCGGPLDYEGGEALTVRCPFCSNSVIVPEELRQVRAAMPTPPAPASPAASASPTAPPQTPEALRAEIKATRQAGREQRRALRHQLREARHREPGK